MKTTRPTRIGEWRKFELETEKANYKVWMKQFDEGSIYGIKEGRITKLMLERDGELVCSYDRGWELKPIDEETSLAYEMLIDNEN